MMFLAYAALWIFVFTLPWDTIVVVIPGIAVLSKATGALAAGAALGAAVMTGRIRRWHPFHVAALLFIIWVSAGQLLFHGGERLPFKYWTYVQLMLVLLIIWELAP